MTRLACNPDLNHNLNLFLDNQGRIKIRIRILILKSHEIISQIFVCLSLRPPRLCARNSGSSKPTRSQLKLSVEKNHPLHPKQLRTHLVLAKLQLGLVLNFGLERMKDGITRIVNGLPEPPSPSKEIE